VAVTFSAISLITIIVACGIEVSTDALVWNRLTVNVIYPLSGCAAGIFMCFRILWSHFNAPRNSAFSKSKK